MVKAIKYCLLSVLCVCTLSACVSKSEMAKQRAVIEAEKQVQQQEKEQLLEKIVQLEASAQQWQAVQPGVERLVNIETELNSLISQLNSIVVEAEKEKKAAAKKELLAPAKKTKPAVSIGKMDGFYTLQLSSVSNGAAVENAWATIYKKNAAILSGHQPLIEKIVVKGKTYYRIKAGKFASKDRATELCQLLKKQKTACFVRPYIGLTLPAFKEYFPIK